jgi:hypothetical protein
LPWKFGATTPMLTALTLALAAAHSSVHAPEPVATPDALLQSDVRVVLQANETHFVATNPSFETVILVFGSEELGVLSTVRLAPGAKVTFGHVDGDEADVWVEVLCISPGRIDSGAHQVSDIVTEGGALWIVQRDQTLEGFCSSKNDHEDGVRRTEPTGDLVMHVPGGPGPRPKGDTPPVIGGGPLPVV